MIKETGGKMIYLNILKFYFLLLRLWLVKDKEEDRIFRICSQKWRPFYPTEPPWWLQHQWKKKTPSETLCPEECYDSDQNYV